jgi:hypothetical protein
VWLTRLTRLVTRLGLPILTNLVTPSLMFVTNLVTEKQQVSPNLINLIKQICV